MKKNNKDKKLQKQESIETAMSSGFDDFAYNNMDDDYQYYEDMSEDFVEVNQQNKSGSTEIMVVDTQNNDALYDEKSDSDYVDDVEKPIKLREIAVQSDVSKVNAFDLFFLRLWAGMVSLLGYIANGINYIIFSIFKHKLPVKYIKAFLVVLLIILLLVIIIVPATANSHPRQGAD
ncbi:MAG TPA: hypothetical protein PLZ09_05860, partial [Clostridia bacterium]|nr:hypothetical protein [Clostridia bacterium]